MAGTIILVHGTWGKRSPWTMSGSRLRTRLERDFPNMAVERFEWSGKNRHDDRAEAARGLVEYAEQISALAEPVVMIGHSHGGSVVERALLESRPNYSGIAVGTPFLRLTRSSAWHQSPALDAIRLTALAVGIFLTYFFLRAQLRVNLQPVVDGGDVAGVEPLNTISVALGSWSLALVQPLLWTSGIALIWMAVSIVRRVPAPEDHPVTEFHLPQGAHPPHENAQHRLVAHRFDVDLQVIRTTGDEASYLLFFGRWLGRAVEMFRLIASKAFGATSLAVGVLMFMIADALFSGTGSLDERMEAEVMSIQLLLSIIVSGGLVASVLAAAVLVGSSLTLSGSILAAVESWLCGFDGASLLKLGRVHIVGAPVDPADVTSIALSSRLGKLRHSRLMSDPASVDAIAKACRRCVQGPSP